MMKIITVETHFGPEQMQVPRKPIRFKQIKVVMETLEVREDVAEYLPPDRRYNSPEQIAALFQFLTHEAKEYFLPCTWTERTGLPVLTAYQSLR